MFLRLQTHTEKNEKVFGVKREDRVTERTWVEPSLALGSRVHETELGVPGRKQGWGAGVHTRGLSVTPCQHTLVHVLLPVSQALMKVPACLFCTKDY